MRPASRLMLGLLATALAAPSPCPGPGPLPGPGRRPAADPPADDVPSVVLRTRTDRASGTAIRSGTLRVWEDRRARAGRVLELDLVVLPALGPDPRPDPVFFLAGGPGQAAASLYPRWVDSPLREHRDVVLVSQRGTGGSGRLACPLAGSDDNLQGYLDPIFDPETFRECLERLAARADLRHYSTPAAMDDLDDLRRALGYERINLIGGSYGTRAALVYLRRHGDRVRAAVLNGVAPLAFTNPLYHARSAQDALDAIFEACAADPECRAAYPDPAAQLGAILARLDAEPARVTIRHPRTGRPETVRLGRAAFVEALRVAMYYDSRAIPRLLHHAFEGDFAAFAQRGIEVNRALRGQIAFGMLLCVTCAEDVDRIDPDLIGPLTDGTFLGDDRVRQQTAVCEFWPRSPLPEGYGEPVRAAAPVLVLSGTLDPVTPPAWGEEAARHLPNSLHLVVPGSHGVGGPCIDAIVREFLDSAGVDDLDAECVERIRLGAFDLEP